MNRRVEIGRARERVEIIDEPAPGPNGRIGRMRHANGENVPIDHATLARLMARAEDARDGTGTRREPEASGGVRGVLRA